MQSYSDSAHNLTAAFLFLRTASTAVANLTTEIESAEAMTEFRAQGRCFLGIDGERARLEAASRELEMWEARLVQAGVGVVNWAAKVRMGQWLPEEILGMIGERLRKRDLVLPEVW